MASESTRLSKGEELFGACPFCGGPIEFFNPLTKVPQAECQDCGGELVRSGTFGGKYECVAGPDKFIGEEKGREVWKRLAERQ